VDVHAFSHVTGGGLAANLSRVLPSTVGATVERSSWRPAPIFGLLGSVGQVARDELERTLNMGVGMMAVLAPEDVGLALDLLVGRGVEAWVAGEVGAGSGETALVGDYRNS
jgi:phosphoribosylformylglycinamidine cyclo-ligase